MSSPIDLALFIPAITLLLYIPLVCYLDWTERKVDHEWWIPLVCINAPLFVLLLMLGVYQWWMPVISLVAIVLAFIASKLEWIQGADFTFIMFIVLFLQYNPVTGHWLMALSFFTFLVATLIINSVVKIQYNWIYGKPLFEGVTFAAKTEKEHSALLLPISAALWLTILLA